ncbi:aminotransferase class I/II-fold pyridoxal phosphate-dependent enzyme [Candidatus Woesearchaeota archaeon]|nr:aminotransferase class I/II-fold pyridoxal phosphate-dependent enzyme [Candidatus Woesearchaeota archaeon]
MPKRVNTKWINADHDEYHYPHSDKVLRALRKRRALQDMISCYHRKSDLIRFVAKKSDLPTSAFFLEHGIEGIIHTVYSGLKKGSKILLPELGYTLYHKLAEAYEMKIDTFKFIKGNDRFDYDYNNLLQKLKAKPDMVVLIDPEVPLGFSIPNYMLEDIFRTVSQETLVLLDEAHRGFRQENEKDIPSLVKKCPNLLIAKGYSKFYGLCGLRLAEGWCGENAKKMISYKERVLGFDILSQLIAIACLESEQHYQDNSRLIHEQKTRFYAEIEKLSVYKTYETDTEFALVEVPEEMTQMLLEQAKKQNIGIRHIADYHKELVNIVKITICRQADMNRIIDLFSSLTRAYQR